MTAARRMGVIWRRTWVGTVLVVCLSTLGSNVAAAEQGGGNGHGQTPRRGRSIADTGVQWPSGGQISRVLLLRDFNTRVVVLGVTCLGLASGTIGTFLLLRKRSLMADALSHAALPGIAVAFIVMVAMGGDGKNLAGLLMGAFIFGSIGTGCILLIRHTTRLKDDAALGIVLSVFFGLGLSLLNVIQEMPTGNAAGLNRFIFGKAASMLPGDAMAILAAAIGIAAACALLFKELTLLCFDEGFAKTQGWPVVALDVILMALVVAVTVIALQSVGLVLAVAMLIIPAAAARYWTDRLLHMTIGSALVGMASGYLGATISALLPRMPTGPVIVLVCGACFVVSMIFGARRGLTVRTVAQVRLSRRVAMQHLLRAVFEQCEMRQSAATGVDGGHRAHHVAFAELLDQRSWSTRRLRSLVGVARRRGLVKLDGDQSVVLTPPGWSEARRVVRNHRLWEVYLINYADIAPSHVDRDADQIEHVLGRDMISQLEGLLAEQFPVAALPPSPHVLSRSGGPTAAATG